MNREDVARLLDLAQDRSETARGRLAGEMGTLFDAPLGETERAMAGDLLTEIVRKLEVQTRAALAEQFASHPKVPEQLIRFLARDDILVARPVLQHSQVLTDDDLIDIVATAEIEACRGVAHRPRVSPALAAALVERHDVETVLALLENDGCEFDEKGLAQVVEIAEEEPRIHPPLLARPELSEDLAARLYLWVSSELRAQIERRFTLPPGVLDAAIETVNANFIARHMTQAQVTPTMQVWAARLNQLKRVRSDLLVKVLRAGQFPLFLALVSEASGLDHATLRFMVDEVGGKRLAVVMRALSVSKPEFATIFLLSRGLRRNDQVVDPDELRGALHRFEMIGGSEAKDQLAKWRAAIEQRANGNGGGSNGQSSAGVH